MQGTTKNNHNGHCTTTSESTNVKVQNIFHVQNNITCRTNCKFRTAATPHTPETRFVPGIKTVNTPHKDYNKHNNNNINNNKTNSGGGDSSGSNSSRTNVD